MESRELPRERQADLSDDESFRLSRGMQGAARMQEDAKRPSHDPE
jgi:hypothetical protein